MNNNDNTIQSLYDQSGLLDILIEVERYFDNMDLFAYKNWFSGEIVAGPDVSKNWVEVTLKYGSDNFPDPRGLLLFNKQGTIIKTMKTFEIHPIKFPTSQTDMQSVISGGGSMGTNKEVKDERVPILLVKFQIPRSLVNPENSNEYKLMMNSANEDLEFDEEYVEESAPQEEPQQEEDPNATA